MTRRWLVAGRVQGVGFRWFVQQRASEIGLAGWVRNLPDGRVEVVATGASDALETLEASVRDGPRHASVTMVEKIEIPDEIPVGSGFRIVT